MVRTEPEDCTIRQTQCRMQYKARRGWNKFSKNLIWPLRRKAQTRPFSFAQLILLFLMKSSIEDTTQSLSIIFEL